MKKKYIGIYNFKRKGLKLTKMIEFHDDIEVVKSAILNNLSFYRRKTEQYHISIYECESWDESSNFIPQKIKEIKFSSMKNEE